MLPLDSQGPLFLLVETKDILLEREFMRKGKRKHGVHIITFYENECRMSQLFGGCNPEFRVNHVLRCLFMLHIVMFIFTWVLVSLCVEIFYSLHGISIHIIMEVNTINDNQNVTVILLFYRMHSKSFSGHYDGDMLLLWIIS